MLAHRGRLSAWRPSLPAIWILRSASGDEEAPDPQEQQQERARKCQHLRQQRTLARLSRRVGSRSQRRFLQRAPRYLAARSAFREALEFLCRLIEIRQEAPVTAQVRQDARLCDVPEDVVRRDLKRAFKEVESLIV